MKRTITIQIIAAAIILICSHAFADGFIIVPKPGNTGYHYPLAVTRHDVKIDINDDGLIYIAAPDMESAAKGIRAIEVLVKDVEVGETYEGKVTRIMNFGAFIEILPGKEGLLHISKMSDKRVEKVEDVMNIGDMVSVKVTEIDSQNRINLSRKDLNK